MTAFDSTTTDDDLLLAVRYVLNECDATEVTEFEARLGDDSAAQSALVDAVQIVALLQNTPTCEELAPRALGKTPTRRSRQVASLVATTLLVAVVMAWQSFPTSTNPGNSPTAALPTGSSAGESLVIASPALAQTWSELAPHPVTLDEVDEVLASSEATLEGTSDVPDWLLTAVLVEEEQGQSDDAEMGLDEESQL